jgi:hypothetical protein
LFTYKVITPQASGDDFFWPLMVRGVGLGLLSVPITTMSLSTLKGAEIGQGAAMVNGQWATGNSPTLRLQRTCRQSLPAVA